MIAAGCSQKDGLIGHVDWSLSAVEAGPVLEEPDLVDRRPENDDEQQFWDEATGLPLLVLEAEAYVYSIFSEDDDLDIYEDCHRPIIVTDPSVTLDEVLDQLQVDAEHRDDLVVDDDVILFWSESSKRIITGADILGRLLKGIVRQTITDEKEKPTASPAPAIETPVEEASVIKG